MKKLPIGIIDMNINNISILNYLTPVFKHEDFIYINDLQQLEYEGLTPEAINERVKKNIDILLTCGIKLLIVVSNTIIEYCLPYLKKLPVPFISIVDVIIDYVNNKYEHKNMAFLASTNIMEANLYQKRFRYNHLYPLISDELDKIINDNKLKTNTSFSTTKELFKPVMKKDVDIIIPTTVNMMLMKTEINEYMPFINIVNIPELICDKINNILTTPEMKGKGKTTIYINVSKKKANFQHLLSVKYKLKILKEEK